MLTASLTTPIGKLFQPLLDFVGAVLAFFFSIIPNYPIDVALLTIVIMVALTPLTVKSTKNMAAMQALAPEMKKLQQKYKGADKAQMNEEMMRLYKEHNVNPASGCLPMLLQMPAFFILYSVIRGMTNTVTTYTYHTATLTGKKVATAHVVADPRYIPNPSKMRTDIIAAHGQLNSFGMNFAQKLLSHHDSIWIAIPYLVLVAAAVGLQYLQMSRLNARNPGAQQANPQAAMMQKYMPLIFGFIYLNVAAILNVYFIVSSAIRILTQEILFRKGLVAGPPAAPVAGRAVESKKGPVVDRSEKALPKPKPSGGARPAKAGANGAPASANGSNGSNGRPKTGTGRPPTQRSGRPPSSGANGTKGAGSRSSSTPNKRTSTNGSNGNGSEAAADNGDRPKEHPRSKTKRERKAR
jgi:YidC/Oxa1 family membrane protein insertase